MRENGLNWTFMICSSETFAYTLVNRISRIRNASRKLIDFMTTLFEKVGFWMRPQLEQLIHLVLRLRTNEDKSWCKYKVSLLFSFDQGFKVFRTSVEILTCFDRISERWIYSFFWKWSSNRGESPRNVMIQLYWVLSLNM